MVMEIPHRGPRSSLALPEIYIHESNQDHFRTSSRSSSYNSGSSPATSAIPMSIPNSREFVPPPLPPPKHLDDIADGGNNGPDLAWKFGNTPSATSDWGGSISSSVAPGSSLYGNPTSRKSLLDDRPDYFRRTSSTSTIKSPIGERREKYEYPRDEGYSSIGTSFGSYRLVCQSHTFCKLVIGAYSTTGLRPSLFGACQWTPSQNVLL